MEVRFGQPNTYGATLGEVRGLGGGLNNGIPNVNLYGTDEPTSDIGVDGQIYIQDVEFQEDPVVWVKMNNIWSKASSFIAIGTDEPDSTIQATMYAQLEDLSSGAKPIWECKALYVIKDGEWVKFYDHELRDYINSVSDTLNLETERIDYVEEDVIQLKQDISSLQEEDSRLSESIVDISNDVNNLFRGAIANIGSGSDTNFYRLDIKIGEIFKITNNTNGWANVSTRNDSQVNSADVESFGSIAPNATKTVTTTKEAPFLRVYCSVVGIVSVEKVGTLLYDLTESVKTNTNDIETNHAEIEDTKEKVNLLTGDVSSLKSNFTIMKNLFIGIETGKYYIAWNIGDTISDGSANNYCRGYFNCEGLEKVTFNSIYLSDSYSHFIGSDGKKVAKFVDCRVGGTRVYNVPPNAKYAYVSYTNPPAWEANGMVAFDSTEDIATNPYSAFDYPYNTLLSFADGMKLKNGTTIGEMSESVKRIYRVEKDGSGDFARFIDAIAEATKYMDSVVYVGSGTFDLLEELGSDYVNSASSQKMGIVLQNRVHVICSSQTILSMKYDGTLSNAKEYLSPINTGIYGCILENATIIDNNVRYSVHDDQGWSGSIPYRNKFINCTFIHKNGKYGDCLGGGLGENCEIEIRGCYFEGDETVERLAYYHGNNHTGVTNAKGNIIVSDNYFANKGSFWLNKYGDSTEMTTALVSNNSFGSEPKVVASANAQDNMRMLAWNNEIRN